MTDPTAVPQPSDLPARPGNHPKEKTVNDWPNNGPDEFRPVLVKALQDPEVREAYEAERVNPLDWEQIPRMLQELCDGHPGYSVELYRLGRSWFCKNCFVREWEAAGRPIVTTGR